MVLITAKAATAALPPKPSSSLFTAKISTTLDAMPNTVGTPPVSSSFSLRFSTRLVEKLNTHFFDRK